MNSRSDIALVLAACAVMQGCYLGSAPMTYLSPQPLGGDGVMAEGQGKSTCINNSRLFTHTWASVTVAGNTFCFTSPKREDKTRRFDDDSNPWMCAGRKWATLGMEKRRRIIFFVTAEGADLAYDHAVAALETHGRTYSAKPMVHIYPAVNMPNYASKPKAILAIIFDEACDFDASYRLTLSGITSGGQVLPIQPVDFRPTKENFPIGAD